MCLFEYHGSGVLTVLFGCYMAATTNMCHVKLLPSWHVLCTPYNHALYHITSCTATYIYMVYVCLAVTCHLHFWQNDWDLLLTTAVTRGWDLNCDLYIPIQNDQEAHWFWLVGLTHRQWRARIVTLTCASWPWEPRWRRSGRRGTGCWRCLQLSQSHGSWFYARPHQPCRSGCLLWWPPLQEK